MTVIATVQELVYFFHVEQERFFVCQLKNIIICKVSETLYSF